MSAFVERMAKAHRQAVIFGTADDVGKSRGWDDIPESWRDHHRNLVRAVLAAAREPSEGMLSRADSSIPRFEDDTDGNGDRMMGRDGALLVWQAAIDEALKP